MKRKKRVMVVCPSSVDRRELALLASENYEIFYDAYDPTAFWQLLYGDGQTLAMEAVVDQMIAYAHQYNIDGIFSAKDYPGSVLACLVADKLGMHGPLPQAVLTCQHKYLSRMQQARVVPEAVPRFCLVPENVMQLERTMPFPCFVKPVKAMLSFGAMRVNDVCQLRCALPEVPRAFTQPLIYAMEQYDMQCPKGDFIAEELLEGQQVTVEGYVFQGKLFIRGIVDSIMYPGTISFSRFVYPSSLPHAMQEQLIAVSAQVMSDLGFDNGMFNIEFMCDIGRGQAHIIEINPRMASHFADLYQKVDGTNSYELILDLCTGKEPAEKKDQGKHQVAASLVLRAFQDQYVRSVPQKKDIEAIRKRYPDARIALLAKKGERLSQQLQDSMSYRYALIHLGAESHDALKEAFDYCTQRLQFDFQPC